MSTNSAPQSRTGRPLDPDIDEAVFAEVLRLVAEDGIGAISRQRVAAGASVSRQTLYNRWPTVGDMVLDALLQGAQRSIGAPHSPDSPNPGDLRAYLQAFAAAITEWAGPALRAVVTLAQSDPAFAARFRANFLAQRHDALDDAVWAFMGRHVDADIVAVTAELIAGSMWYRVVIADGPLDERWVAQMVDVAAAQRATAPRLGVTLGDEVVTVRPFTSADAEAVIRGRDDESQRFLGDGAEDPSPAAGVWVGATMVGWVDHDADRSWLAEHEVNVGYAVFPEHRGQGHATRAVRLLCDHLAAQAPARRPTLLIDPANAPSLRLAERLGFRHVDDVNGQRLFRLP
ncbi:MAG: GNAT family N-acetyltransferase [Actinomycetota bacterium]